MEKIIRIETYGTEVKDAKEFPPAKKVFDLDSKDRGEQQRRTGIESTEKRQEARREKKRGDLPFSTIETCWVT